MKYQFYIHSEDGKFYIRNQADDKLVAIALTYGNARIIENALELVYNNQTS